MSTGSRIYSVISMLVGGSALSSSNPIPTVSRSPTTSASFIASAALPAAGAWTSASAHAIPAGAKRVSFSVSYTGAAAGGAVKYRFRKGFSSTLAAMATEEITPGDVTPSTAPVGQVNSYDLETKRPVSGTTATIFACDFDVQGGWTHCTLELAEYGATGTPGTASATVAESF